MPLGLPLFFLTTLAIIAPFAGQVTGEVDRVLVSLGLATLLALIFVACGLGISHVGPAELMACPQLWGSPASTTCW